MYTQKVLLCKFCSPHYTVYRYVIPSLKMFRLDICLNKYSAITRSLPRKIGIEKQGLLYKWHRQHDKQYILIQFCQRSIHLYKFHHKQSGKDSFRSYRPDIVNLKVLCTLHILYDKFYICYQQYRHTFRLDIVLYRNCYLKTFPRHKKDINQSSLLNRYNKLNRTSYKYLQIYLQNIQLYTQFYTDFLLRIAGPNKQCSSVVQIRYILCMQYHRIYMFLEQYLRIFQKDMSLSRLQTLRKILQYNFDKKLKILQNMSNSQKSRVCMYCLLYRPTFLVDRKQDKKIQVRNVLLHKKHKNRLLLLYTLYKWHHNFDIFW